MGEVEPCSAAIAASGSTDAAGVAMVTGVGVTVGTAVGAGVAVASVKAVAAGIPGARLVLLDGLGHRPDIRLPDIVNPILARFLGQEEE